jgi:hypothetical protein
MTNSSTTRRDYVDSLFVSSSYGDKVRIRTFRHYRGDSYVITVNGRRVVETRLRSTVRAYIVDNDCRPVESF